MNLLRKLTLSAIFAFALGMITVASLSSCGNKTSADTEEAEETEEAEHPEDAAAEQPADSAEHPSDSAEHPADTTSAQ